MSNPTLVTTPGLCPRCRWMRLVESARGSQFTLCERSFVDPAFRRYPVLPVSDCRGFEPVDPDRTDSTIC
ncbi:MAG: hypothetical protein U0Q55_01125 [Vicinamibacterales bacterium]